MVKNILAAFDKRVENLTWMAPATKAEARKKIETMRVGVGYPDTWRNYGALEIKADNQGKDSRRILDEADQRLKQALDVRPNDGETQDRVNKGREQVEGQSP